MKIDLQRFESQWVSISIAISAEEVDQLVRRLLDMKNGSLPHFHVRTNDFDQPPSVADIEFSMSNDSGDSFTVE